MIERAAAAAKLGIKAHAHMLRHAGGCKLANDGVDTRSLQAWAPQYPKNHTLYGAGAGSIQGFFGGTDLWSTRRPRPSPVNHSCPKSNHFTRQRLGYFRCGS